MRNQDVFRIILDSSIVFSYSVFAFFIMPLLVIVAWLGEKVLFSEESQMMRSPSSAHTLSQHTC